MRKCITILGLLLILGCICTLFWYAEWRYSLPTPVPAKYQSIQKGEHVSLTKSFSPTNGKPVFLHFFNPDCPCSKFNIPHFKTLASKYANKINFAVVIMNARKNYTIENLQKEFGLTMPLLFDSSIAVSCGVYSTPQAVLLNADGNLYYRGNYNRNRYCTNQQTNYAQVAIDSLLAAKQSPLFNQFALTAYGCSLPVCKK
jgi:thiol-disulfide isomerase/thioredoxin